MKAGNEPGESTERVPLDAAAAYEGLMRAKEAYRAEAHRLARELADAKEALKPFADIAEICDHFKLIPGKQICSWRIKGKRHYGPTAADCREARRVLGARHDPHPPPRLRPPPRPAPSNSGAGEAIADSAREHGPRR